MNSEEYLVKTLECLSICFVMMCFVCSLYITPGICDEQNRVPVIPPTVYQSPVPGHGVPPSVPIPQPPIPGPGSSPGVPAMQAQHVPAPPVMTPSDMMSGINIGDSNLSGPSFLAETKGELLKIEEVSAHPEKVIFTIRTDKGVKERFEVDTMTILFVLKNEVPVETRRIPIGEKIAIVYEGNRGDPAPVYALRFLDNDRSQETTSDGPIILGPDPADQTRR